MVIFVIEYLVLGKHIFSIIRMLPIGHKWLTNPTYQSLVVEEEAIFMSKTQYPRPPSHRLTNPTYRSLGDAISMSKNPIPKKRKIYFCCDYFYNVNFHRSVLVENLNSEISLALADHFRRPQKFSCRFENNNLPFMETCKLQPIHSHSIMTGLTVE